MDYSIKRSRRSRRITITVKNDASVVVTIPARAPEAMVEHFVVQKTDWIKATQEKMRKRFENKIMLKQSKEDFKENKEAALAFVTERLAFFNTLYNFKYGTIRVRNQKSRWGSCSIRGNLNFNYSIVHLPQELADYIVVHELCHLKEFNHSKNFWNLVAEALPDYDRRRTILKKNYIHVQ